MKILAILLTVCAVGKSLFRRELYEYDRATAHRVPKGDNVASDTITLANSTIVFYDKFYDKVTVNTDGFITLGVHPSETSNSAEGILAPFMFDLHATGSGEVYYQERRDEKTLARATKDILGAYDDGIAGNFQAKSVFLTTWENLQCEGHSNARFTFQTVVATDGHASYVIFLYPSDELAAGEISNEIRNQLTARVGFSDEGSEQLEELSAAELVQGGNAWAPGIWVFQIGGVLGYLEGEITSRHVKTKSHHRRQSGFQPPEVNVGSDYNPDQSECGSAVCDANNAYCTPFEDGYCCECVDGFVGNGINCVQENGSIPFNGAVDGYLIVMNPDNSWTNESGSSINMHSFSNLEDGRAFSALAADEGLSSRLILALQPMTIFTSTLGWMIAKPDPPAVNGFGYSGGVLTSDTYIRYTTGAYEFRIIQQYSGLQNAPEVEGSALRGKVTFNGRLPAIDEGVAVTYEDYTQIYMKTAPGSIRSRDTRTYTVGDVTHSYTVDQSIRFESCEPAFEDIPQNLAVDVSQVYTKYFAEEQSLRFAMDSYIRRADEVGVRPTEPTPRPRTEPTPRPRTEAPAPSQETEASIQSMTICEQQFAEAQKISKENPFASDSLFIPTCTRLGTFTPRQCQTFDAVCWCVDQDTGDEIDRTRTEPNDGYKLDCSDIESPTDDRTPCQVDRDSAEQDRIEAGDDASSVYMPRCMESGAYEPVQQLPDGSFMCVDFNGAERSRSTEQPECLTPCQLQAYIAKTSNIFLKTHMFEISCQEDGEYAPKQCVERYCYCVDASGQEIANSRLETTIYADDSRLDCEEFRKGDAPESSTSIATTAATTTITTTTSEPVRHPPAARLIFAQSMGINSINLPVSRDNSVSKRLFASSDQTAVGLSYDCSTGSYFWTDVSKRRIYSSNIDGDRSRTEVISTGLRSPEGIAVDFLSGNIYWTDSDYDHIAVSKADGTNRVVLVSEDMVNPRGIAVDPIRGRMYWTDWNRRAPKIWVADMDGGNRKVLVSDNLGLPNDITIDFFNQKVCFVDAGTYKVECMSLDGKGRRTIYQMKQVPRPHPFGLVVNGDMLYYSSWGGSKIVHAVNWRTGEHVPIAGPRGAHGQMYGVELVQRECPRGYNRCSYSDNGGCNHLCLPTPSGHVCKCPAGSPGCEP